MSTPHKASVVVCTYNQPRELDLALAAMRRQTQAPVEVFVADDGSSNPTKAVVEEWHDRSPFPVHHVWQADKGYRKARIVNEAVRRATGDHIIFLDGDSFPQRSWVADHLASADGKSVLCGRRVKLGSEFSPAVTRGHIEAGRFDTPFAPALLRSSLAGDTKRLGLAIRLPRPIARLLHPRPRRIMGVNFSLPLEVFTAVNGLNEDWVVYGHEDRDIEFRLIRAGVPRIALLNRAVVFHLHHEERERSAETRRLIAAAEASDSTRCEHGYDLATEFDPYS
jgi:GT2 family glycosyltransferase